VVAFPLAFITAVLWDDFLSTSRVNKGVKTGVTISYYLLAVTVIAGAIVLSFYINKKMPEILTGVLISSLVLIAGFVISAVFFAKQKYLTSFFIVVGSLAIFLLPLNSMILPKVERYEASKEVAQKLLPMMKDGEALGSQSNYLAGLAFYTNKVPVDLDKHYDMVDFLNSDKRVWCVIKYKNHRDLYDTNINKDYVKPTYLIYTIGKRSIVTNEVPEGTAYILKRELDK